MNVAPVVDEKYLRERVVKLKALVLELTTRCNFRCSYCSNGSHYELYENKKSDIEEATIKKALLYFDSISQERKVYISFYGGEPLLRFAFLKKCVEQSEKILHDREIVFSMTTNGFLINMDVAKYLIEKKFMLTVSLDGPKNVNDLCRKTASGEGSHKYIEGALQILKKLDRRYFERCVGINSVVHERVSLEDIVKYFSDHPVLKKNRVNANLVKTIGSKKYQKDYMENRDWKINDYQAVLASIMQKEMSGLLLSPLEASLLDELKQIKYEDQPVFNSSAGTCLFDSRLFVDTQGNFYPCEKVDRGMVIGNVMRGFDYTQMCNLFNDYSRLKMRSCKNCKLKFGVEHCFADCYFEGNQLRLDDLACEKCERERENWEYFSRLISSEG